MNIRRKLLKGGHLSEKKCLEILRLFCEDLTATEIADASNISRVTINNYCRLIRSMIMNHSEQSSLVHYPDAPLPHSDFQGGNYYAFYHCQGNIISRWLDHNFILPQRNENKEAATYHAIANSSNWHLHWIQGDGENLSGIQEDISTFWMFTKARLQKFRGMNKNTRHLHIKESEFRYNFRDHNIFSILIETIQNSAKTKNGTYHSSEKLSFS